MRNVIVEKLNKHIQKCITSEADVVYLMVETRKLLEHTHKMIRDYPVLAFYTNWTVHTRLSRTHPGRKEMLNHINKAAFANMHFDKKGSSVHVSLQMSKALSFYPLRKEMDIFFRDNNVRTDLVNNTLWNRFILLLIEILIDTPLDDIRNEFSSMREFFLISKSDSENYRKDKKAIACWKIICSNGSILEGPVYL